MEEFLAEADLATKVASALSGNELLSLVDKLTQTFRLTGSAEEKEAFLLVKEILEDAGLKPHLTTHPAYVSIPLSAFISCGDRQFPAITHSFSASTGDVGVTAPCLDLGTGIGGSLTSMKGFITICESLARSDLVAKFETAGAIGQIFIGDKHPYEIACSPVWGSPASADMTRFPTVPVVSVSADAGKQILELAAQGKKFTIHTSVDTSWREIPQLIADICPEGVSDLTKEGTPFVLLSGHIDAWHYGAMDNGSANAAMVALAKEFVKHKACFRRGLRFAFWSGHSHAKYAGSARYADDCHEEIERQCIAHVNLDSIGGRGATVLSEGAAMPCTFEWAAREIAEITGDKFVGGKVPRGGDQSFVQVGVPTLFMTVSEQPPDDSYVSRQFGGLFPGAKSAGVGWWWHTPEDTVDKLDAEFMERDCRIVAKIIGRMVASPKILLRPEQQVEALCRELRDIAAAARPHFDLSSIVGIATRLEGTVKSVARCRESRDAETDADVRAILELLRPVIEVYYCASGPYEHDQVSLPLVPQLAAARYLETLAEPERQASLVGLRRRRNYVNARLGEALKASERALKQFISYSRASEVMTSMDAELVPTLLSDAT